MTTQQRHGFDLESLPVVSAVDGAVWPALPGANGMALSSLLLQFAQSEWLSPDRIAALQAQQVTRLVSHAKETVPFYRDRLPASNAGPITFDGTAWREIPVLTRQQILDAGVALASTATPEAHGSLSEIFTSGSTGRPIRSVRTQLCELYWSAFTLRDHLWHRRHLSGTLAAIRESAAGKSLYPDGSRWNDWGSASASLLRTGPCLGLNIMTPIDRQLEWLQRHNPDYLVSHPTNIARLAALSLETGVQLARLRQVQSIAEVMSPQVRSLVTQAWGATVADIYSAREIGYLALQCPESEHYHIQSEGVVVELLDDDSRPCQPGEIGRVVVTALHNFAMPLIRYDLGDRAEAGPPCACGRGLPVLRRILGREQNMLELPTGERRWTLLSSGDISRLTSLAPVRQYQFIQRSLDEIEMRLVTARPLIGSEELALTEWFEKKFGHPFSISFTYLAEIPRDPSGKFADFISEV